MALELSLSTFSGPLDLLLEMARDHKVSVLELELRAVADQYGEYVSKHVADTGLEEIAEYLVMAAYLYSLKAKTLLPVEVDMLENNEADLERDRLVTQLIEYQRYKEILGRMKELSAKRAAMFSKAPEDPDGFEYDPQDVRLPDSIDPDRLAAVIKKVIARYQLNSPVVKTIVVKELSAETIEAEVVAFLSQAVARAGTLTNFMEQTDPLKINMQYFVVTLVALLTLARDGIIAIRQTKQYDEIEMALVAKEGVKT